MDVRIRLAKKSDIPALADVYAEVYTRFDIGEKWTPEKSREILSYYMRIQPDLCFMAESGGKPVGGFFVGVKPWWDGNHLFSGELFVHPDHQKGGIGTKLCIRVYEESLEKYGVTLFETMTFKGTEFPLKWYKSHGFSEDKDVLFISGDIKTLLRNLRKGK